jgi:hypothetical protein
MTIVALVILAATVALVFAHERAVHGHEQRIEGDLRPTEPEVAWPPAAIILCVRGAEAGLTNCLDRLAAVEYSDVELHVVVDHVTDPSLDVAEAWQASHPEVACHVHILSDRSPHATLKCSGVDQALRRVSSRVEVVVIVDADARVYPQWLQDMIRPVVRADTGMATGNRWYDPTAAGIGSLIRFVYNANCVMPMHSGNMTWGGSLALRRDVFEHAEFRPCLRRSPTEDATVRHAIEACGHRLACLPAVMLLTSDPIGLSSCLGFIRRQLLWTRLYHPGWPLIAGSAAVSYAIALAITAAAIWAAWNGHAATAVVFTGAIVMAILGNLVVIERLHAAVAHAIHTRQGILVPPIDWLTRLRLLAAIPLTLPAFCWAAVSAAFARQVTWSGVRYAVVGRGQLELVDYRPVASPAAMSLVTGLRLTGAIAGNE